MKKAMIVLSGGQDSATCLAWALEEFDIVGAITFDYGQRHKKEIIAASRMCSTVGVPWQCHDVSCLKSNPLSSLTNETLDTSSLASGSELPSSFLPARNLIFLTQAAAIAIGQGVETLITGVCQTDYNGYPDCRRETMNALEHVISLGCAGSLQGNFEIITPLMFLSKAETVLLASKKKRGVELVAMSWTCYEGGHAPCGQCPACKMRAEGFAEAKFIDPVYGYKEAKDEESRDSFFSL
jgi:7-cyano-7-deazaguanine synthase